MLGQEVLHDDLVRGRHSGVLEDDAQLAADFLGQLVPPGDSLALAEALGEVLQRPPATERIAAHARQFTWERAATAYHRLISEAVA